MKLPKQVLPKRLLIRLVIVAVAGIFAWFNGGKYSEKAKSNSATTSQTAANPSLKEGDFDVFLNCKLINHEHNDGDSFHVAHGGSQIEYRLYYVDTPESRDKPYDNHQKRVKEQGLDMGGLSYKETISLGKKAKKFTTKLLKQNDFDIYTKHELVYGGPREYAFVRLQYQGKSQWLHEILAKENLARVHTWGTATPEGQSYKKHKSYLQSLTSY